MAMTENQRVLKTADGKDVDLPASLWAVRYDDAVVDATIVCLTGDLKSGVSVGLIDALTVPAGDIFFDRVNAEGKRKQRIAEKIANLSKRLCE